MILAMKALPVLALVSMVACSAPGPDAPIRDVRPTTLQRGDKLLVEASGAIFRDAPTTVVFDDLALRIEGRVTSPMRVVATIDRRVEAALGGRHVARPSTVSIEQLVDGEVHRFSTDPRTKLDIDLFPPSLAHLANGYAARAEAHGVPGWVVLAMVLFLTAALVALPVPVLAGLIVVWERKISGYMQSRLGPNRVGPGGWLQWLADGLKLLMKEDVIPREADARLFRAAPYVAFLGLFLTFLVLPFSHLLIVSDLNIGLLFLLSVTSLVVVSIIMGGWSSNSKWSLLGGMRSAAQIISYELPASMSLLTIATLTGTLSTQRIVEAQGALPWDWYLFRNPFTFIAFFIWFISALAEGNRTPFDLPEAESELVAGYNTEYSGFRFSLFPLVEWVNLFIIGAVASMLFLGGWRLPWVTPAQMEAHRWLDLVGLGVFLLKDIAVVFVVIWIRWTLPRFRVDQMMNLCWKYFIPGSFAAFVGVLAWAWLVPPVVDAITRVLLFLVCGVGFGGWFTRRVLDNRRRYRDLVLNEALGRANA
jgi:NADH:ubiquinone oxidoreductase subunit H